MDDLDPHTVVFMAAKVVAHKSDGVITLRLNSVTDPRMPVEQSRPGKTYALLREQAVALRDLLSQAIEQVPLSATPPKPNQTH
jgi:hypothetical protein